MQHRDGLGTSRNAAAAEAPPLEVAAVVEPGRRGLRVLDEVEALARTRLLQVTLVAVVPHVRQRGCAVSPTALNDAIDEAATKDLATAGRRLPLEIHVAGSFVLREHVDPPPREWLAGRGIELVIAGGRRRPWRGWRRRVPGALHGEPFRTLAV